MTGELQTRGCQQKTKSLNECRIKYVCSQWVVTHHGGFLHVFLFCSGKMMLSSKGTSAFCSEVNTWEPSSTVATPLQASECLLQIPWRTKGFKFKLRQVFINKVVLLLC